MNFRGLLTHSIVLFLFFSGVAFGSGNVGDYVQVGDGYLGTAATRDAEDVMTDGPGLPDGHAIKTYGDANWSALGDDYKVKVSTNDTITDFLWSKLTEGDGIDFTHNNEYGDADIIISGEVATSGNKGIASFAPVFNVIAGSVNLATDGITDLYIDWGTGVYEVSAVDLLIADAGIIITATEVEGALQENRTAIDLNTDKTIDDTAYNEGTWNANTDAATKNAIRDKIETMGSGADVLVKVSTNDTTADYLWSKITEGDGIDLTHNNEYGNADIVISGEVATAGNAGIASFAPVFNVIAGSVNLAADGITDTYIDWGTGVYEVSAVDLLIADAGVIIDATEVEGALQENRTAIDLNTAASHAESHSVASHNDTTATGAELNTLTDNSMADTLHRHSELSASDGSPDRALVVDTAGKVGIGTTTPSAPLEVSGRISQIGLGGSTYLGYQTGNVDDLSDNFNTGIGYQSLYYNTTGDHNTASGCRSLHSNTTGYYNTASGYHSLYSNTTGK